MSAFDATADPTVSPATRRRPEFAGGSVIVLPDGHRWRFAKPVVETRDVRGEQDIEGQMIGWDFGVSLDLEANESLGRGFHRILAKIHRAKNRNDRACGYLEAAWYLLARNYDVTRDEFEEILLANSPGINRDRAFGLLREHVNSVASQMTSLIDRQAEEE